MYVQTLILPVSFVFTDDPFLLVGSVFIGGKLTSWCVCCQIATTQTLNPKDIRDITINNVSFSFLLSGWGSGDELLIFFWPISAQYCHSTACFSNVLVLSGVVIELIFLLLILKMSDYFQEHTRPQWRACMVHRMISAE